MKRLYVFADFDWLKAPRLVGELSYESLRGSDSYGFCYSDDCMESISKMMGHTNIRTTQGYAKVTDDKISEDMDRLIKNKIYTKIFTR